MYIIADAEFLSFPESDLELRNREAWGVFTSALDGVSKLSHFVRASTADAKQQLYEHNNLSTCKSTSGTETKQYLIVYGLAPPLHSCDCRPHAANTLYM